MGTKPSGFFLAHVLKDAGKTLKEMAAESKLHNATVYRAVKAQPGWFISHWVFGETRYEAVYALGCGPDAIRPVITKQEYDRRYRDGLKKDEERHAKYLVGKRKRDNTPETLVRRKNYRVSIAEKIEAGDPEWTQKAEKARVRKNVLQNRARVERQKFIKGWDNLIEAKKKESLEESKRHVTVVDPMLAALFGFKLPQPQPETESV